MRKFVTPSFFHVSHRISNMTKSSQYCSQFWVHFSAISNRSYKKLMKNSFKSKRFMGIRNFCGIKIFLKSLFHLSQHFDTYLFGDLFYHRLLQRGNPISLMFSFFKQVQIWRHFFDVGPANLTLLWQQLSFPILLIEK